MLVLGVKSHQHAPVKGHHLPPGVCLGAGSRVSSACPRSEVTAPPGVCVGALHLRNRELEHVADGLFEGHDDGHLDEQICQTPAGMTLEREQTTQDPRGTVNSFSFLKIPYHCIWGVLLE